MKKYLAITILFSALCVFGRSDVESIDLSLQSLESNESILDTSVLDTTLDHYRGTIAPLYKRYQATQKDLKPIEAKFSEAGIPLFFTMIPYSESKFNPHAKGYNTAGLWQFSKQSARNFGLSVKKGNDGRLDINRSTEAVIRYIKSLKKEFGTWYLADFAYGMGEGNLKELIEKNKSKKISVLLKDPHFPSGTKAHFAKTLLLDAKVHYSKTDEEENKEE
ncbi:MAG: lytic transglycosylase domain-containing protein [Sulfuricurvum sp.]|uniref:lytic transglycosylase domain-containing protein n=1 Tax=Sulfuricurvum sp. TaxID=2025608 RepID=UPI002612D855|nr:lytic transglycosylase domain-containing protein [Sulfuricurvum sp.]MDD2368693.1 lytic transglycosylase domain-containing protein [Sulfuricurvum sp.]MDD5118486.1 lytic transglycosylase domain-containing protein [Sulfuricurvum sp.]